MRRSALLGAGALGAALAVGLAAGAARDAAALAWPPFVLVAGLLLIGTVANQDGLFVTAATLLGRIPGGATPVYAAAMLLVALVTVFLNLDTSVAFLTPVLVHLARRNGSNEQRFLYGCVFMSNAASLLLPGSNLTNLLVLADLHITGSAFLSSMFAPWAASVLITAAVVAAAFRGGSAGSLPAPAETPPLGLLSLAGICLAVILILVLGDPALPILAVGLLLAGIRLAQRRIGRRQIEHGIDMVSLLGLFLVAVALGTLARVWSDPGRLMLRINSVETAVVGALASVVLNNLPAAVLLGSHPPAYPRSLLFGLNIGPNLAVSGSLSALIWWQAARSVGARPSAIRYSAVGLVLVPLTLGAALLAEGLLR